MLVSQSVAIATFTLCADAAESTLTGNFDIDTRQLHGALDILRI